MKIKSSHIIVLYLMACLATASAARAGAPEIQLALGLTKEEKHEEARLILAGFLTNSPESPDVPYAEFLYAKTYYQEGDYPRFDNAVRDLDARNPNHPALDDLRFVAGMALEAQGRLEEALNLYSGFESDFPDSTYVDPAKRRTISIKERVESKREFDSLFPAFASADYTEAEREFQSYISTNPDGAFRQSAEFYRLKSIFEQKQYDRFDQEAREFVAAWPEHPSCEELTFLLAYSMEKQFRFREAAEAFSKFVTGFPESRLTASARRIYEGCVRRGEPAMEDTADYVDWLRQQLDAGDHLVVLANSRRFLEFHESKDSGHHVEAIALRLESRMRTGQFAHAMSIARHLSESYPNSPVANRYRTTPAVSDMLFRLSISLTASDVESAHSLAEELVSISGDSWWRPYAVLSLASATLGLLEASDSLSHVSTEGLTQSDKKFLELCRLLMLPPESSDTATMFRELEERSTRELPYYNEYANLLAYLHSTRSHAIILRVTERGKLQFSSQSRERAYSLQFHAIATALTSETPEVALSGFEEVWSALSSNGDQAFVQYFSPHPIKWALSLYADNERLPGKDVWLQRLLDLPASQEKVNLLRAYGQ